jgi:hypothetical protein
MNIDSCKLRKAVLCKGADKDKEVWVHGLYLFGDLSGGVEPLVVVEYQDGHLDYWSLGSIKFLETPHD